MPFDLNINFAGLCGFAFNKPVKGGPPPTEATIVMPNLLLGELLSGPGIQTDFRAEHFPQLIYPLAAATADSPPPALQRPETGMGLMFLYEEDVRILPDGRLKAAASMNMDNRPPTNLAKPTAPEQESLFWLTALTDAFPTSNGKVDPSLLLALPSSTGPIIAKLTITEGRLRTAAISNFACTFEGPASS